MVRQKGRPDLAAMLGGINTVEPPIAAVEELPAVEPIVATIEPDVKIKRCYVITDKQLEMVMTLHAKNFRNKDMSQIVGMAIESFFKEVRRGTEDGT